MNQVGGKKPWATSRAEQNHIMLVLVREGTAAPEPCSLMGDRQLAVSFTPMSPQTQTGGA